jgi:hypothetical protein
MLAAKRGWGGCALMLGPAAAAVAGSVSSRLMLLRWVLFCGLVGAFVCALCVGPPNQTAVDLGERGGTATCRHLSSEQQAPLIQWRGTHLQQSFTSRPFTPTAAVNWLGSWP